MYEVKYQDKFETLTIRSIGKMNEPDAKSVYACYRQLAKAEKLEKFRREQ